MSSSALSIATILYVVQAFVCARNGQLPQVMILGGYVLANFGLIWSMS